MNPDLPNAKRTLYLYATAAVIACRETRLNCGGPPDQTVKTEAPCHSSDIWHDKNHTLLKSDEYKSKSWSPSSTMMTPPFEVNILELDDKQ